MRSHLLPLSSSSRSFLFLKSLTSSSSQSSCPLNLQFGRCYGSSSHGQNVQEKTRASSTADEFKRVAEEKMKQGVAASQTLEKTCNAAEEGKPDSISYEKGTRSMMMN